MKMSTMLTLGLIIMCACGSNAQTEKQTQQEPEASNVMDIHAAAFMGDVNAIKYHIKAGTDLNKKDQYGSTPLITASTFNKIEVAKALIEGKADLNVTNYNGATALHVAAFLCRTEIVTCLLKHGADKTIIDASGANPLQAVSGPFDEVKPVYEQLNRDLGVFGLRLDYQYLEENRPKVAALLK
ncbi:ankyrin repeat domain-containing protein [Carboxylicivirga sp. RSCT41]|uniref:ankyrin repeat domain-containing protein n=1 Tax=Carboxylicivirga agarovorans TaxID=3417570 RepID=UPI003D32B3E9